MYSKRHNHKYALSFQITALSASILSSHHVRQIAHPFMLDLRDQVHETIQLAVLEGLNAVIIETQEPYFSIRPHNTPGQHLPAYAVAIGKILLAYQWDVKLSQLVQLAPLLPYTSRTITSSQLLIEELHQIRLLGYAISDGELENNIKGIAAPIFNTAGVTVAALSISGPTERCHAQQNELIIAVTSTVQQISLALQTNQPEPYVKIPTQ